MIESFLSPQSDLTQLRISETVGLASKPDFVGVRIKGLKVNPGLQMGCGLCCSFRNLDPFDRLGPRKTELRYQSSPVSNIRRGL